MSTASNATAPTVQPATLGEAHLLAERSSEPSSQANGKGSKRRDLPPWRFYRDVIRMGLYLSERAHLNAGDRVVSLMPLTVERLVLDWATVTQGAVSIAIDPEIFPPRILAASLKALAPRIVLLPGRDELTKLELIERPASLELVLVLTEPWPARWPRRGQRRLSWGGRWILRNAHRGFARARAASTRAAPP